MILENIYHKSIGIPLTYSYFQNYPEEEWKVFTLEEMLCERQERLEEGEEGEDIELLTSYCEVICTI